MFKVEDIAEKVKAGTELSEDEVKFAEEHADEFDADVKDVLFEEVDEKELDKLMEKSLYEKVDKAADRLVKNFMTGVGKQRSRILDMPEKDPEKDAITREFMKALLTGDKDRLKQFREKTATFNEDADTGRGGYLVPPELVAEVLRVAQSGYGIARSEMRYLPFSGPGMERKIPTLLTGVSVTWTGEGVAKTASNPTFSLVTQVLKKLAAIIPFTEELLEDSAINLTQLIATLFAEAIAKEEDAQFFAGTGSPWTGILNNGSVNTVDMGAGDDMSNITADDLLDMIDKTPAGALGGAKFYLHRHALSYIRKLKAATTGEYIFQSPGGGLPNTIWDYPYVLCEAFPDKTAGAAHTTGIVAFGNLKQAAILGDKQQIRAKLLDQATVTDGDGKTTLNLAEMDMLALRLEERVGYLLALPDAITVLKTGTSS